MKNKRVRMRRGTPDENTVLVKRRVKGDWMELAADCYPMFGIPVWAYQSGYPETIGIYRLFRVAEIDSFDHKSKTVFAFHPEFDDWKFVNDLTHFMYLHDIAAPNEFIRYEIPKHKSTPNDSKTPNHQNFSGDEVSHEIIGSPLSAMRKNVQSETKNDSIVLFGGEKVCGIAPTGIQYDAQKMKSRHTPQNVIIRIAAEYLEAANMDKPDAIANFVTSKRFRQLHDRVAVRVLRQIARPEMKCYAVTGTRHGSFIFAMTEGWARRRFHQEYSGESITHVKRIYQYRDDVQNW